MAAELKPYPGYKDSGVEWLGAVPAHWEVRHLGRIGRLFKGGGGTKEDERESGVPCVRYGDLYTQHQFFITATRASVTLELANTVYTPIRYGDVLFAGSGETIDEIGKSAVNLIPGPACCGGDVIILRPSIDADARFLGYAMDCAATARQKARIGRGFTVVHIYSSDLKYVTVAIPSLPEQAAIVRFLDHADRRIRRYIRAKEKLIALLEEQKQAVIREAVTGEVDVRTGRRYPAYKSSDAEWLGNVPDHWGVEKLGQCGTIAGGMTPSMENPRFWHGSIPWITPKDMKQDVISDSSVKVSQMAVQETSLCRIEPLAVLIVVRGMILARKVPIAWTTDFVTINQDMKALVPRTAVVTEFLAGLLRSAQDAFMQQVDEAGHGTRRLPTERLRAITVTLPPKDEQERIVEHLREKLETVEAKKNGTRKLVSHFLARKIREGSVSGRDTRASVC